MTNMEKLRNNKNPWAPYDTEVPHSRCCDPAGGVSPAERLSPEHLQRLKNAFTGAGVQRHENRPNRRSARNRGEEHGLHLEAFRGVLRSVIGPDVEDTWVERFFSEVDIRCTGQVKWEQLCSYLLLEYTERERASIPKAALQDSQQLIRHCYHNKREATVRVVAVPSPPPLRYISVSKGGQITVWNSSLHILRSLGLAGDPTEEVANTRRFRGWATDAVWMGNVHRVAVATDRRDLHFVDMSTASLFEDIHLFGFRSVPTALCYWHNAQCPDQPSLLLLGDEKGGVHLMWFLNPSKGLFKIPSKKENGPQRIFFPDLAEHSSWVSHRHIPNIHQEPINRVTFEPESNVVMTSSESDSTSVVFINVALKQEPYIWRFKQGAKCFDYNESLQLMVTGGCDQAVRLWTRFVTTHPVAVLLGHSTAVLDVTIYQPAGQIFSYSRDAELKVWDISTHHCLKTIYLQFPCQQPGRIPDHGNFPFLLLSPPLSEHAHLIVACKDHLALLPLSEMRRGEGRWLTDEGRGSGPALSCALYSSTLRLVVTGHVNSSVSLWDVETGRWRLQILNAHGEEEVTCMTLDSSHRRLISGSRSGTIKVWNLLNGLNLHKLEPITDSAVTGLTCLSGDKLLAVGWSQRIVQYDIAAAKVILGSAAHTVINDLKALIRQEIQDLHVRADMSWKSRGVHTSDILAVSQCATLGVVATVSHDGEVVIWRLETQGPLLHLQKPTQTGEGSPVDSLLFLQHRAGNRTLKNKGVLVLSQAGCLSFWSVTGETNTYGQFYAPEEPGERVLSLGSDQTTNTMLVSGDTSGWLQIWDISHFALDIQHQPVRARPLLLQCWKAHKRTIVSVEVIEVADRPFILTASADGSASLWTKDGNRMGCFGQEVLWNMSEPATYQRKAVTDDGDRTTEGDNTGLSEVKSQVPDSTNRGQTSQKTICSEASSTRTLKNDHEQPQQPMYLCEDFCQNGASCRERRRLFDDIRHSSHC